MQASFIIKLSKEQNLLLKDQVQASKDTVGYPEIAETLLMDLIHQYAEKIGYELQIYHSREKVSQVNVVSDSIVFNNTQDIHLKLQYVIEEFSACSAIDTLQQENMKFTAVADLENEQVHLKGEFWPEL